MDTAENSAAPGRGGAAVTPARCGAGSGRVFMAFKLFLLFTVVPCLELALLIQLGGSIGTLATVVLVIVTGIVGALAVRAAGLGCLQRIRDSLARGAPPADELCHGLLILLAGAFLITPGLMTDAVGFALLVPAVRAAAVARLQRLAQEKMFKSGYTIYHGGGS